MAIGTIISALATLGAAIGTGVANKRTNERNAQHQKEMTDYANKLTLLNRKTEDSDKVQSLKAAGLNPALAYSGSNQLGNVTSNSSSPYSAPDLSSASDLASNTANLTQQSPLMDAQTENQSSDAELKRAEAEKIRLENEEKSGQNKAAYDKLKQLGINTDNISIDNSFGYLSSTDFGDEVKTKGVERGLRQASASVQKMFYSDILSDQDLSIRFKNGMISQFDNMVKDVELKKESILTHRQNRNESLSRIMLNHQQIAESKSRSNNLDINTLKTSIDMDYVKAQTQVANESSYQFLLSRCATAIRTKNAEDLAYWNMILSIKSGQFDNLTKTIGLGENAYSFIHAVQWSDEHSYKNRKDPRHWSKMHKTNVRHQRGRKVDPYYYVPK